MTDPAKQKHMSSSTTLSRITLGNFRGLNHPSQMGRMGLHTVIHPLLTPSASRPHR